MQRGVLTYGAKLAARKQKLELVGVKKLEIWAPPFGEHPTIR